MKEMYSRWTLEGERECYTPVTAAIVAAIAVAAKKEMERASHHPTIEDNVDDYPHC